MNARYVELFRVGFLHGYYNRTDGRCPDFDVAPSSASAALMSSLGMLFRDFGSGFGVYIDRSRLPALIDYVRRGYRADASPAGYWAWLTFLLVPRNPALIGVTALPIDTNPMLENLYASNLQVSDAGSAFVFGNGAIDASSLVPVTGATLAAPSAEGSAATLLDISGSVVASVSPTDANAAFNLAALPYGLYRFAAPGAASVSHLYVPAQPRSLCAIDLLLTQPAAGLGDPAAFPVPPLPSPPSAATPSPSDVHAVDLTLAFNARDTFWEYYVVSQNARAHFGDDLTIVGSAATFRKSLAALPNGDQAVQFTATTALPLRAQSPYRFELSGHRRASHGSRDDVSIKWLPTAPAAPVWPAPSGDTLTGSSHIYVYI